MNQPEIVQGGKQQNFLDSFQQFIQQQQDINFQDRFLTSTDG